MFWVIETTNLKDVSGICYSNNKGELFIDLSGDLTNINTLTGFVGITTNLCYTDLYNKLEENNIPFGANIIDAEIYIFCLGITFVFDIDGGVFVGTE